MKKTRKFDEIKAYEEEAFDKVWLMRTHPCDDPEIEDRRFKAVERILSTVVIGMVFSALFVGSWVMRRTSWILNRKEEPAWLRFECLL